MPAPEPVASQTSLKERLARLKLQDGAAAPPPPPANPSSASGVRTGRVVKVGDTISRFQAKAEAAPLLPEGGSFGFAPAKPRASGGGSRDRDGDKPRVASLGGGRAAVPLNVVTARSVSSGNSPTTRSESGSTGSAPGSRATSRQGSSSGVEERAPTPQGEPTPVPSPTASTSSVLEKPLPEGVSSLSLPSGARTPGTVSVSSMRVETGSLKDEGAAHNPADIDISAAHLADELHSPLSSPIITAIAPTASSTASVSSSDGVTPSHPSGGASKNPLGGLNAPSRAGSVASLSSMVVEAPSGDIADLSEVSTLATPTTELAGIDSANGDNAVDGTPTPQNRGEDEASEAQRAARVEAELEEYEQDELDPAARVPGSEEQRTLGNGAETEHPAGLGSSAGSIGQAEKPEELEDETKASGGDNLPKVRCNDCGVEVDLMELADHSCAPSKLPPALSSPPPSPQANRNATLSPALSSRSFSDLPQDEPTAPSSLPTSPASPRNLASSIRSSLSRSSSHTSRQVEPVTPPATTLDRFVPQTSELVPEDVPEDLPEDILDAYGDEELAQPRSVPPPRDLAVPEDIDDEEGTSMTLHPGIAASASSSMTRSASTPSQTPAAASQLRAQKKAASGPRSQSVYGGTMPGGPLPGKFYDSGDEDDYEPGSVVITRTTASHRA